MQWNPCFSESLQLALNLKPNKCCYKQMRTETISKSHTCPHGVSAFKLLWIESGISCSYNAVNFTGLHEAIVAAIYTDSTICPHINCQFVLTRFLYAVGGAVRGFIFKRIQSLLVPKTLLYSRIQSRFKMIFFTGIEITRSI